MKVLRLILFCLFFAVGASAVALAILVDEIQLYHHNTQLLEKTESLNTDLENMIDRTAAQLAQIEKDPNILANLKRVTFAQTPADQQGIYPKTNKQISAAVRQLMQTQTPADKPLQTPAWLARCSQPRMRLGLFLAGAGLLLINFIFFSSAKQPRQNSTTGPDQ